MRIRFLAFTCLLAGLSLLCDLAAKDYPGYTQPLDQVSLKDGKVLRDFQIKRFEPTYVMAQWSDGAGTIAYSDLPADLVAKISDLIPVRAPATAQPDVKTPGASKPVRRVFDGSQPPPWPDPLGGSVGAMDGPKQTIQGQIFVVTKGGNAVKLALVTVRIVSADLLKDLEAAAKRKIDPNCDYWDAKYKRASANGNYELARVYLNQLGDVIMKLWDVLPPGPMGKSDADGKFLIEHSLRPPFVVLARGSRYVGEDQELYEWRVPSSQIAPDGKLMLSNDNMVH